MLFVGLLDRDEIRAGNYNRTFKVNVLNIVTKIYFPRAAQLPGHVVGHIIVCPLCALGGPSPLLAEAPLCNCPCLCNFIPELHVVRTFGAARASISRELFGAAVVSHGRAWLCSLGKWRRMLVRAALWLRRRLGSGYFQRVLFQPRIH